MVLMIRGYEVAIRTNGDTVRITCPELSQLTASDSTLDGALTLAEDAIQRHPDRARPRRLPNGCSMSDTALDDLKRIRAAFAEDRRAHIKEAVSLLPANRHAAFQEAMEALDLQTEIEALDRAISDEESLADRPKGAA